MGQMELSDRGREIENGRRRERRMEVLCESVREGHERERRSEGRRWRERGNAVSVCRCEESEGREERVRWRGEDGLLV